MKKKGLLRVSAGLAAVILSGATLAGCCGGGDEPVLPDKEVDESIAKISNKEALLEEWGVNGGGRTVQLASSVAKIRSDGNTIEFKSSDETVATIDGAGKITPVAPGKTTISIVLNGKVVDSVEISLKDAVYQSIETVVKAVLDNKGDATPVYSFKGVVTALIGTKAFTVQQGDYAFYVYKNPATSIADHPIAVGDVVTVTTHAQLYNGLVESKEDTTVTLVTDETAETINAKVVQNKDLTDELQSVLVNVNGLSPVGALTPANSSTYGVLNIKDGTADDKTISIYVNKYLDSAVLTAINEKLNKLANEAYTANLKGVVVSKNNDFQYLVTSADQIELVAAAAVNPTKIEITNKTEVAQLVVGTNAKINMGYEPENCNAKAINYTSSDATIASVDSSGKITANKSGTVTITATSAAVNTLVDTVEVNVIAPKFVTTPIVGEKYYFGFNSASGLCYFNGEMDGYYGKTVGDKANAITFTIEKGADANDGKFALKGSNGKYIDIEVGSHINYKYVDAAAYFSYDAANFCYYKVVDGKNYYFGTYGTYVTVSAGENVRDYPARLYPTYMNEAPRVGSEIKMTTYHYNLETPAYLSLDGTLDGTYFKTGDACVFTVEVGTAENTYALKNAEGKYLAREEQSNDKGKFYACVLADAKSTATDLVWNAANMTFETVTVDPGKCLGTSGTKTYTTIGYTVKDKTDMCWMHVYLVSEPAEHGESKNDPLTPAEALAKGEAELTQPATYSSRKVYVKGTIVAAPDYFNNGSTGDFVGKYYLSAGDKQIYVVNSKQDASVKGNVAVGDEVIVGGFLYNDAANGNIIDMFKSGDAYPTILEVVSKGNGSIAVDPTSSDKATVELPEVTSAVNGTNSSFKVTVESGFNLVSVKVGGVEVVGDANGVYAFTFAGAQTIVVQTSAISANTNTVSIKNSDAANGTWTETTEKEFTNNGISLKTNGVKTGSGTSAAKNYGYWMINNGYIASMSCPENSYVKEVTVKYTSGTGTSGKIVIEFSATPNAVKSTSTSGSAVTKSGSKTEVNNDNTMKYFTISNTASSNAQIEEIIVVYDLIAA